MKQKYKLTSQVDPKVPFENMIEVYDLSPQRIAGLPLRASVVNCIHNPKKTQNQTRGCSVLVKKM